MMTINNLKEATGNRYNRLIDMFLQNNTVLNSRNEKEDEVSGLVFFKQKHGGNITPCGYLDTKYFSLFPVRVRDNMLYISFSTTIDLIMVNTGNTQKDIDEYNESSPSDIKINYVLMTDGTIYEGIN
jgi:hypothetical protein